MKLLLDENVPEDFRHFLPGHEVFSVGYMGWKGLGNGSLLAKAAEQGFDALISVDASMPMQQESLPVALLVLRVADNSLGTLRPLVARLLKALETLTPKSVVTIP